MIDGGFFKKKFQDKNINIRQTILKAKHIVEFSKCIQEIHAKNLNLLRIYFYDCPPATGIYNYPISKKPYDLETTPAYKYGTQLLADLKRSDFFAVREGILKISGWKLRNIQKSLKAGNTTFKDKDFALNMVQKGVDVKIGIDMAWISFEKISERILFVTGDSDFIPAIKLARRNGIQVFLLSLNHGILDNLKENVDVLDESSLKSFIKF